MNKINFKPLVLVVITAVLLSSCAGLSKMKKNADQIQFKVTPELLEAHAGDVSLAVNSRFPAKYFDKKATIVATPVLKYEGGEKSFAPVTVQGENVEANNKVIGYTNGGSVSYKNSVSYDK